MTAAKTILVLLRNDDAARAAEALRGAIGLTLRGDRVVVATGALAAGVLADPRVRRNLEALRSFGHEIRDDDGAARVRAADAVEVWT